MDHQPISQSANREKIPSSQGPDAHTVSTVSAISTVSPFIVKPATCGFYGFTPITTLHLVRPHSTPASTITCYCCSCSCSCICVCTDNWIASGTLLPWSFIFSSLLFFLSPLFSALFPHFSFFPYSCAFHLSSNREIL